MINTCLQGYCSSSCDVNSVTSFMFVIDQHVLQTQMINVGLIPTELSLF